MPSIAVQSSRAVVSAATNKGRVTVDSNAYLFPGANAWLSKDDGSLSVRVKILACIGTDTLVVRRWPTRKATDTTEPNHDLENFGPPGYGLSDVSAFNGVASHISMETQAVPVDPAYVKRVIP